MVTVSADYAVKRLSGLSRDSGRVAVRTCFMKMHQGNLHLLSDPQMAERPEMQYGELIRYHDLTSSSH